MGGRAMPDASARKQYFKSNLTILLLLQFELHSSLNRKVELASNTGLLLLTPLKALPRLLQALVHVSVVTSTKPPP